MADETVETMAEQVVFSKRRIAATVVALLISYCLASMAFFDVLPRPGFLPSPNYMVATPCERNGRLGPDTMKLAPTYPVEHKHGFWPTELNSSYVISGEIGCPAT